MLCRFLQKKYHISISYVWYHEVAIYGGGNVSFDPRSELSHCSDQTVTWEIWKNSPKKQKCPKGDPFFDWYMGVS